MQQLILGTGTAIWWLTEPHYTQYRHYDDTYNDFTYNDFFIMTILILHNTGDIAYIMTLLITDFAYKRLC